MRKGINKRVLDLLVHFTLGFPYSSPQAHIQGNLVGRQPHKRTSLTTKYSAYSTLCSRAINVTTFVCVINVSTFVRAINVAAFVHAINDTTNIRAINNTTNDAVINDTIDDVINDITNDAVINETTNDAVINDTMTQ